ncbi:MAG: extracellular solute-binding protein [Planctomycetota bacterium]
MSRHAFAAVAAITTAATLLGCDGSRDDDRRVVLYSSVDRVYMDEVIIPAIEAQTGLDVVYVGDNEINKTTGLVLRVESEMDEPVADVWWSSEPFGTIRLAGAGALEAYAFSGQDAVWPERLSGENDLWRGFAQRARVIAFSESRVGESDAPRTLAELTDERWRGRVGIARPEFGTTRGHMGALLDRWGADTLAGWLRDLDDNGVRIYSGNADVVRAIAAGEIDVGLTDTDDVWAARRNGSPVGLVYEAVDPTADPESFGPLLMPNTVALVRGGPNPEAAALLIDWITSAECERLLAESDSRNIPAHAALAGRYPDLVVPDPAEVDFAAVAARIDEAMELVGEHLDR